MSSSLVARIARRPRRALTVTALFLAVAVVLGGPVFGALEDGDGFVAGDAQSARAVDAVEAATGTQASPGVIAIVRPGAPVASSAGRAEIRDVARRLAATPGHRIGAGGRRRAGRLP